MRQAAGIAALLALIAVTATLFSFAPGLLLVFGVMSLLGTNSAAQPDWLPAGIIAVPWVLLAAAWAIYAAAVLRGRLWPGAARR